MYIIPITLFQSCIFSPFSFLCHYGWCTDQESHTHSWLFGVPTFDCSTCLGCISGCGTYHIQLYTGHNMFCGCTMVYRLRSTRTRCSTCGWHDPTHGLILLKHALVAIEPFLHSPDLSTFYSSNLTHYPPVGTLWCFFSHRKPQNHLQFSAYPQSFSSPCWQSTIQVTSERKKSLRMLYIPHWPMSTARSLVVSSNPSPYNSFWIDLQPQLSLFLLL